MKLGKLPARKNSVSLRLRDYLSLSKLPPAPESGGHVNLVTEHDLFGNDQYGDCVCAEAGHTTILFNKEANKDVQITTDNVLEMYSALTGFNPNDPSTDQGTDMAKAAKWRKKTGLLDASGKRHKISAYLALTPGNIEELKQAIHLFSCVGVGWELPESAQMQFEAGLPWTVTHSPIEGGHDTGAIGYDPDFIYIITWGKVQKVTYEFFSKYCDEGIVYFSEEMLENGKSLEGFNVSQLRADLGALK